MTLRYQWLDGEPMLALDNDERNVAQYLNDLKIEYSETKQELANALHRFIKRFVSSGTIALTDNIVEAKRKILEEKHNEKSKNSME